MCAKRRRLPRLFRRNGVGEIVQLVVALHNIHGLADPFVADGDALTDPPVAAVLIPVAQRGGRNGLQYRVMLPYFKIEAASQLGAVLGGKVAPHRLLNGDGGLVG